MSDDPFRRIAGDLQTLREQNRFRRLVPRTVDGIFLTDGQDERWVNFGSNDYLGIAAGGVAGIDATRGGMASSLVCGWTDAHDRLAHTVAEFEQTESAVIFPTGFAACSGTVATLARDGDLILSDALNHASLIDGCRLSRADRVIYPHRDVDFVEQTLRNRHRQSGNHESRQAWIVTDGVFSMDGHVAPLADLCDVAQRHGATMIVDEAHGTGVLGDHGRGVCEALGVKDRVKIRIGTLSKAVASQGGFVAAPRVVTEFLINRCRTLIYSTSLAPGSVELAQRGIETIRDQPQRRDRLRDLTRLARSLLHAEVDDPIEATVPIVSLLVGEDRHAVAASSKLADAGFYVPAIRPPTVPDGAARLRISITAAHDETMLRQLADAWH